MDEKITVKLAKCAKIQEIFFVLFACLAVEKFASNRFTYGKIASASDKSRIPMEGWPSG